MISRAGVEIAGLTYDSPALDAYRQTRCPLPGFDGKWPMRVDWRDLGRVWFQDPRDGRFHELHWRYPREVERPFGGFALSYVKRLLVESGMQRSSEEEIATGLTRLLHELSDEDLFRDRRARREAVKQAVIAEQRRAQPCEAEKPTGPARVKPPDAWTGIEILTLELAFLPDGILDQLPTPSTLGATRTGGLDMNRSRVRAALAAALALAVAPAGFTVAEFTAKVRATTGQTPEDYSVRQGAYDLRKLRGKQLVIKPGRTRRYHASPSSPRGRSPRYSPSATRSSRPSPPGSAHHDKAAHPRTGPPSTATTKPSAATCKPSSPTSASRPRQPPHRQRIVDRVPQPSR